MRRAHVHVADDGFWERSGDAWARGHAFRDGEHLAPAALAAAVEGTPVDRLASLVADLNGFFSVIREAGGRVFLAVDHVRSYPLYYGSADGEAYVSDDAHWVKGRLPAPTADPLLEFELLLLRSVTGRDTLYPAIEGLEAGECAVVEPTGGDVSVTRSRHTRFEYRPTREASEAELLAELDDLAERAVERLVEVADGRQLVLALSGGPDSRLLACMLARLGHDDLLAFTYGHEGNWDSAVAVEVAEALSVPIEVVRYDHDGWADWFRSDERVDYYRYAFNFDAAVSIGAVPAVGELERSGAIDDDAVVFDGNIATTEYDYTESFRRAAPSIPAELAGEILDRLYTYWKWDDDDAAAAFRARLESQIDVADESVEAAAVAALKDWRIRNLNAKFHVTPEEYAFWGHESWTPLWDVEYMRFWERVPLRYREDKRLHRTHVDRLYREVTGGETPPGGRPTGGPLNRFERAVARSPADRVVRPVYKRLEDRYKRLTRPSPYHRDPVATTGIVPEAFFDELCFSPDHDVHPFKALELLGCIDVDPPRNRAGPVDGRLDLERLRTDTHADYRESLPWFRTGGTH